MPPGLQGIEEAGGRRLLAYLGEQRADSVHHPVSDLPQQRPIHRPPAKLS
jgi:hypothetical protein